MAFQSMLGLICDPIANRVEVPCLGKNVMAASNALACANMALAGYDPVIPLDEVIETAKSVAGQMPRELRCTALGGLSITPTSKAIEQRLARNRKAAACGGLRLPVAVNGIPSPPPQNHPSPMQLEYSNVKKTAGKLKFRTQAFIDGKFVNAASGKTYVSVNPATGQPLAHIASCDVAEVDLAVQGRAPLLRSRASGPNVRPPSANTSS